MRRSLVGMGAILALVCLPAVSEAGRRCGGGGCAPSCGYASCSVPSCGYAASCSYQYVTSYHKERQKVWVWETEQVMVDVDVVECRPTTREEWREYQVWENQSTKETKTRTVYWCEWTETTKQVKVRKPVTTWQDSTVKECVAVQGTTKQTVWECKQVVTPTAVERCYTTWKRVATPAVRNVVCYTPQVVAMPPSCCNPCGSTCSRMVPTVRQETCTVWTCVPEVQKVQETVNVVSWQKSSREVDVPVVTYKWVDKPVKVAVCSYVEDTVDVKCMVPVQKQRNEDYDVWTCKLVPRTVKQKVQIRGWENVRSTKQVPQLRCKKVEKEIDVMVPVTTCVQVAPAVCCD